MLILAMHVDIQEGSDPATVLNAITKHCRRQGIAHTTVQMSAHGEVCPCISPIRLPSLPPASNHT
jgi:hypothetical protein